MRCEGIHLRCSRGNAPCVRGYALLRINGKQQAGLCGCMLCARINILSKPSRFHSLGDPKKSTEWNGYDAPNSDNSLALYSCLLRVFLSRTGAGHMLLSLSSPVKKRSTTNLTVNQCSSGTPSEVYKWKCLKSCKILLLWNNLHVVSKLGPWKLETEGFAEAFLVNISAPKESNRSVLPGLLLSQLSQNS